MASPYPQHCIATNHTVSSRTLLSTPPCHHILYPSSPLCFHPPPPAHPSRKRTHCRCHPKWYCPRFLSVRIHCRPTNPAHYCFSFIFSFFYQSHPATSLSNARCWQRQCGGRTHRARVQTTTSSFWNRNPKMVPRQPLPPIILTIFRSAILLIAYRHSIPMFFLGHTFGFYLPPLAISAVVASLSVDTGILRNMHQATHPITNI